jgi:hypothetical protein
VAIAWFFLWLGIALFGLSGVVFVMWYRQRRFERRLVTFAVSLLLAGLAAQEVFLAAAAFSGRRALEMDAFVAVRPRRRRSRPSSSSRWSPGGDAKASGRAVTSRGASASSRR